MTSLNLRTINNNPLGHLIPIVTTRRSFSIQCFRYNDDDGGGDGGREGDEAVGRVLEGLRC